MNDVPDSLDLRSTDIAEEKRRELLRLFPEVATEGGKCDIERLKLALGDAVDVGKERYGMNWPGKADCFRTIQAPSLGALRPCPDESVAFASSGNLIIEGDNLETLKLLQKSYLGRVKVIYIDPPYNTGNDFIYPDNFAESLQTYLAYTGQVDEEGKKFGTNPETDGRFHSKWLSMMYPRLYLARNLLRDDGVIFISIDDNEVDNLRHICNEVFGEENFLATLVWEKTRKNDAKFFSLGHEYAVVYARSVGTLRENGVAWREAKPGASDVQRRYEELREVHRDDDAAVEAALRQWYRELPAEHPARALSRYKNVDRRGVWRDRDISWPGAGGPTYELIHPATGQPCAVPPTGWRFSTPEAMAEQIVQGLVVFREDHTKPPFRKAYLTEVSEDSTETEQNGEAGLQVMPSVLYKQAQVAAKYLRSLFGQDVFDNPKDHEVLARWIRYCTTTGSDDIVLDFFAGSGSTADAVLRLNAEDGGSRRFILIQLPEPTGRTDYPTIAEITKERVRRVIAELTKELAGHLDFRGGAQPDLGFRVFKLAESSFETWNATGAGDGVELARQLELHVNHIRADRTPADLLYEILLKSGFPLTSPIESLALAGKTTYSIAGGALLVCLDRALTIEAIRALADQVPERVVCLDEGFAGNDQLKANAVQIFKTKGVTSFKTV